MVLLQPSSSWAARPLSSSLHMCDDTAGWYRGNLLETSSGHDTPLTTISGDLKPYLGIQDLPLSGLPPS